MKISVQKMFILPDCAQLKAFADIVLDDVLVIKGLRVVEGKNGLFVTMPREQGKDNKWYDQAVWLNSSHADDASAVVLTEYHKLTEKENVWNNLT